MSIIKRFNVPSSPSVTQLPNLPSRPSAENASIPVGLGDVLGKLFGYHLSRPDQFSEDMQGWRNNDSRNSGDVEDVFSDLAGYKDSDIAKLFDAYAGRTGNSEFSHNMWGNLLSWLEELNKRQYDREQLEDQRKYNEEQRDNERGYNMFLLREQRRYDLPENEIARLMATGMSRRQAIEILQGSSGSGGAGVSSPSVLGNASPFGAGAPGGAAGGDNSAQFANYAAGVNSIVNSLQGLAQLPMIGISTDQALKQNALLQQQVNAGAMLESARNSVGAFTQALYARNPETGMYLSAPTQEQSVSFESLMDYAGKVTKEQNPALHSFMNGEGYKSMVNNPFAHQLLIDNFTNMKNAQRDELEKDVVSRSRFLQNQQKISDLNLLEEQINFDWLEDKYEDYGITRGKLNSFNLMKVQDDLDMLSASRTKEQLYFRVREIQKHNEFQSFVAAIDATRAEYLAGRLEDSPAVRRCLGLSLYFDYLGLNGEIGTFGRLSKYANAGLLDLFGFEQPGVKDDSPSMLWQKLNDYVRRKRNNVSGAGMRW